MLGFGVNHAHELFIMQSDEYKQRVVNEMSLMYEDYLTASDLVVAALYECGIGVEDLTDGDLNEIRSIADSLIDCNSEEEDYDYDEDEDDEEDYDY